MLEPPHYKYRFSARACGILRSAFPVLQNVLYRTIGKNVTLYRMPQNPDDRIQDLCSKAVAVTEGLERGVILSELRALLHERIEQLGIMAQEIARLDTRSKAADQEGQDERSRALLGTSSASLRRNRP